MSWLGRQRIDLDECGSTNDEAARLSRAGASHGTIVIAASQRAGRGRDGRTWVSPPGAGLYLSMVLRPPLPLAEVPPMTLAIGVAICDAVRAVGVAATLKWPNDVLVERRKLAGVLVEAQSQGNKLESAIVGIGVNLTGELPESLHAVSLETALRERVAPRPSGEEPARESRSINREIFIADLLAQLEQWIDRYTATGLATVTEAWRRRMAPGLPARATIDGAQTIGVCDGVDSDGSLLLRDGGGRVHRVRSGDVEVIREAMS